VGKNQNIIIRNAELSDAAALAALSAELGYPTTPAEMKSRFDTLYSNPLHGIFVAELDIVVGWIQISVIESLESELFAEIRGLVVSEPYRVMGIGTQLAVAAEAWAIKKGCRRVRVRTNKVRVETLEFYKKRGYVWKKAQEVFDKLIAFSS
jgi:GNAT superfamily N-acetyltransferase